MILHVARKEILSTLRDRRAIVSNLLIPLLVLPVMMLGLPLLIGGLFEREQTTVTEVGLQGGDNLPAELRSILRAQNVTLTDSDNPEASVRDDTFAAALSVPDDFAARLERGERADITVYSKQGNLRSELNASKIEAAVRVYRQQIVAERLAEAGLDPDVLEPIGVASVDASSQAERSSGQLAWLIPFFIAIWTLTGGQMTAIDATAGEKERGTLEALLVTPIRRSEVVVGKFLATLTFGLSAAVMAIIGYVLSGVALRGIFLPRLGGGANEIVSIMGGTLDVNLGTVLLLFLSALLLAALVAALLIAITLFARSFKEAQSYVAPLSFLLIVPGIGLQFKELLDLGNGVYLVPVFNVLVLMDDVVKGTVQASAVFTTWGILIVTIGLLLGFAYRNFKREGVIFRT